MLRFKRAYKQHELYGMNVQEMMISGAVDQVLMKKGKKQN